jgi:formylglycine-generating enzyme required for sulfatase activity
MTDPLPRPRQYATNLPDAVERVLLKALAKDPKDRYADAGAFVIAMENRIGNSQPHAIANEQPASAMDDSSETMDTFTTNLQTVPETDTRQKTPPRRTPVSTPVKPASLSKPEKQVGTKFPLWGIGLVAFAVLTLIVWGLSSLPASPFEATQTPSPTQTIFVEPATKTPVPATSTATIIPTPIPTLGIGSTMIGEDGATLVYVPESEFMMGSDSYYPDEKPIHKVNLDAFWIDQTEVTNAMYAECMAADKCRAPSIANHFRNPDYGNHPVVYVDWNKANTYCSWAGRELPSEAQWEKAARGTDARIYPWGNDTPNDTLLNYNQKVSDTIKVSSYETGKSIYGAYDMAGNVWEWVNDWYSESYYQISPSSNPLGPNFGQYRLVRGGAWNYSDSNVRSVDRFRNNPTYSSSSVGFRCARSLP